MKQKKILITGCYGQVGWELQRSLATLGNIIAIDQEHLDLSNPDAIIRFVRELKPDLIVHPAAYTAVDKAEIEPDLAMAVNGTAPGILAEEAKKLNATFVHYSTDYVYDGNATTPYDEKSITGPLSIYGHTKLAGDLAVEAVGGKYLILRTSWVYGTRGKNFLLTMLKLAKEKEQLRIVNDQFGAPTWSKLIAQATGQILMQSDKQWGLYHLTSSGKTTWCDFAKTIFNFAQSSSFRAPHVIGIPTAEYPLPAKRPMNSVLSNDKVKATFNVTMPSWEKALELCMKEL